jgi:hypothetical protein
MHDAFYKHSSTKFKFGILVLNLALKETVPILSRSTLIYLHFLSILCTSTLLVLDYYAILSTYIVFYLPLYVFYPENYTSGPLRQPNLDIVVAPMLGTEFYPRYRDFVIKAGATCNGPIYSPYKPAKTARKSG